MSKNIPDSRRGVVVAEQQLEQRRLTRAVLSHLHAPSFVHFGYYSPVTLRITASCSL